MTASERFVAPVGLVAFASPSPHLRVPACPGHTRCRPRTRPTRHTSRFISAMAAIGWLFLFSLPASLPARFARAATGAAFVYRSRKRGRALKAADRFQLGRTPTVASGSAVAIPRLFSLPWTYLWTSSASSSPPEALSTIRLHFLTALSSLFLLPRDSLSDYLLVLLLVLCLPSLRSALQLLVLGLGRGRGRGSSSRPSVDFVTSNVVGKRTKAFEASLTDSLTEHASLAQGGPWSGLLSPRPLRRKSDSGRQRLRLRLRRRW